MKRHVEYIENNPPEVWGAEQKSLVNSVLQSARESELSTEHQRWIRAFAEAESDAADAGE